MFYNFTCKHKFQSARDSVAVGLMVFEVAIKRRTIDGLSIKFCRPPRKRSSCFPNLNYVAVTFIVTNNTNYNIVNRKIFDKFQRIPSILQIGEFCGSFGKYCTNSAVCLVIKLRVMWNMQFPLNCKIYLWNFGGVFMVPFYCCNYSIIYWLMKIRKRELRMSIKYFQTR